MRVTQIGVVSHGKVNCLRLVPINCLRLVDPTALALIMAVHIMMTIAELVFWDDNSRLARYIAPFPGLLLAFFVIWDMGVEQPTATGGGTRKRHVEDEGGLAGGRRALTRELRQASDELERRLTRSGLAVGSGAAGVRALASASQAAGSPPQEREQRDPRDQRGHTQLQSLSECGSFGTTGHGGTGHGAGGAGGAGGSRQGSIGGGSAIGGLRPRRPAAARGAQVRAQSAQQRPTGTERGRLEEQYQLAQYERHQHHEAVTPVGGHSRHLGYGHGHGHQPSHQRSTATVAGLVAAALDGDSRRPSRAQQQQQPPSSKARGAKHRHPRSAAPSHSSNEIFEEMYELGGSPRGGGASSQLDYDDAPRTRRRQHAPTAGPAHGGQRWPPPQQIDRPATALLATSGYGQQQQQRGGAPLRGTAPYRQPPVTRQQARSIVSQHGYAPQQIAPVGRSGSRYGGGGYGSLL